MEFKEFIGNLFSALSAGASTEKFTRSIFEAILSEDGQDILDGYKGSTYKNFYNGIGVMACKKKKIIGYYTPKIHTKFDVICDNNNIEFIVNSLLSFTCCVNTSE